jgi:hypothetical protein
VGIAFGLAGALRSRRGARPWLVAGVLADIADLVATVRAREAIPAAAVAGVAALAAGSAAMGVWLAQRTP